MLKRLNLLGFLSILWTVACCLKSVSASRQLQEAGLGVQLHVNATTFVHGDWIQVSQHWRLSNHSTAFSMLLLSSACFPEEIGNSEGPQLCIVARCILSIFHCAGELGRCAETHQCRRCGIVLCGGKSGYPCPTEAQVGWHIQGASASGTRPFEVQSQDNPMASSNLGVGGKIACTARTSDGVSGCVRGTVFSC